MSTGTPGDSVQVMEGHPRDGINPVPCCTLGIGGGGVVLDPEATGFWRSVRALAAAGSGLGLGEAEGGNKETTGSSAFISPGYSQLQVSNLISAASCFLRCLAVPRHPLTCHQPREKGQVGGRMGVGLRLSGSLAHAHAAHPPHTRSARATGRAPAALAARRGGGDDGAPTPRPAHPSREPSPQAQDMFSGIRKPSAVSPLHS